MSFPIIFGNRKRGGRRGGETSLRIVDDSWAEYHFDEGSGTEVLDKSGNDRDFIGLTDNGGPSSSWGEVGGISCLIFGVNTQVFLDTPSPVQPFTVLGLSQVSFSLGDQPKNIIHGPGGSIKMEPGGRLSLYLELDYDESDATVGNNVWFRWAVVADGLNTVLRIEQVSNQINPDYLPGYGSLGSSTTLGADESTAFAVQRQAALCIVASAMSEAEIDAAFTRIYEIKGPPT